MNKVFLATILVLGMLVFSLGALAEEPELTEAEEQDEDETEETVVGVTLSVDKTEVAPGEEVKLMLDPNGAEEWKAKVIIPNGWRTNGYSSVLTHEGDSAEAAEYTMIAPSRERTYKFQGRWYIGRERGNLNKVEVTVTDSAATTAEEEETEEEETEEEAEDNKPPRPFHYQKRFDSGLFSFFDILFDVKVQAKHLYRSYKERISGITYFRVRGEDIDCRLNRFRINQTASKVAEVSLAVKGKGVLTCTLPVDVTVTENEVIGTYGDGEEPTEVFRLVTGEDGPAPLDEEEPEE
jgi:hypothetical protein